jgi:hypothetical protein
VCLQTVEMHTERLVYYIKIFGLKATKAKHSSLCRRAVPLSRSLLYVRIPVLWVQEDIVGIKLSIHSSIIDNLLNIIKVVQQNFVE